MHTSVKNYRQKKPLPHLDTARLLVQLQQALVSRHRGRARRRLGVHLDEGLSGGLGLGGKEGRGLTPFFSYIFFKISIFFLIFEIYIEDLLRAGPEGGGRGVIALLFIWMNASPEGWACGRHNTETI